MDLIGSTAISTDEILIVSCVTKDGGSYAVKCPHCIEIIGIEGDDLSEIRGEQFQHRTCGGWLQVRDTAFFVKTLDRPTPPPA